jgi:hypothetical protein
MGISLGDAVLAFAGGAAEQFNKIEDEKRQSNLRLQERAQQLMDNLKVKQIETEYSKEVEDFHKNQSLYTALKSIPGGPTSPQGQIILAEYYGMDLAQTIKTGSFGRLQAPQAMDAPIPMTDRAEQLFASEFPKEKLNYARRVRPKLQGKFFTETGGAIPRAVTPRQDGRVAPEDVVQASGLSINDPAFLIQDGSNWTPEQWDQIGKSLLGQKADLQFLNTSRGVYVGDKSTGEVKEVVSFEEPTESPWTADIQADGRVIWVNKNTQEVKIDDTAYNSESEDELRYSTLEVGGESREILSVIKKAPDGTREVVQQIDLGAKPLRDIKSKEGRKQLNEELHNAGQVMDTINRMQQYVDVKQSGVGGAITNVQGALTDLYQSIPGLPVSYYEEGADPDTTSLATFMAQDFVPADNERAQNFFERRMAQGKVQALETLLIYNYAKLLKPEGKLNVDDISRAESILRKGSRGGIANAGTISMIQDTARSKAAARIRQYVRTTEDGPNFDGRVVWDPMDSAWKYRVTIDGKPQWKAVN